MDRHPNTNYIEEIIIDKIFNKFNRLCWECHEKDDWSIIDDILIKINPNVVEIVFLISLLTITSQCKSKLDNRRGIFIATHLKARREKFDECKDYYVSNDYANKLLKGLE